MILNKKNGQTRMSHVFVFGDIDEITRTIKPSFYHIYADELVFEMVWGDFGLDREIVLWGIK